MLFISSYMRIMLLINEFKNDEVLSEEINDYGFAIRSFVEEGSRTKPTPMNDVLHTQPHFS